MKSKLLLILFFIPLLGFAQQDLEQIFQKEKNFYRLVEKVENHFQQKHPGKSANDLSTGVHRDGKFVKYMRWKSFWQQHLNEDGTLGDISEYGKSNAAIQRSANNGFYNAIPWTNISNTNYITGQISLGRTTSVAFHPTNANTFYVGAPIGGIWKTTDGGQSYTPLGDDLPYLAVSSVVVDQNTPSTIYIAISDHVWYGPSGIGIYKSTDGGATWNSTALSFQFTDDVRIYAMEADPNDPQKMFVATADGLFRTTDGFTTVTKLNNMNCYDVKYKPNNSSTIYVGTNNGEFLKSTDGGANFTQITDFGNGSVKLAVVAMNNQLVAARNGTSLHQSSDSGSTFPQTNTMPEGNTMPCYAPNNPSTIISGNFEIYRSDDSGASFTPITQWLGGGGLPLIHVDQRNVAVNPLQNNYVYYCNDGGLYRYDVNAAQFEDLSDGLQITQYYDIAVSQTNANVVSGGSQDNGSMFRNTAGMWEELASIGDGMNTEIDPTNENIIYWEYQNGGLRRHENGSTFDISPPGQEGEGAWETPFKLDPTNPNRIVVGYDMVYESMDKGNNWTAISPQLAGGSDLNQLTISKSNPNRIYTTQGTTLYVKDVSSNTWTSKSTPATINISDIEVDPMNMDILYITNSGYGGGSKVFKSIDAGDNWVNISGTLPNVSVEAIEIYENASNGLFVGTDYGVYYMDDQLTDWERYGNMPNTRVTDIEIQYAEQLIRAGTHGRGVLEAPINIQLCPVGAADADTDGFCDLIDACPYMHNDQIGTACDDGDPFSSGETYSNNCICEGGMSNIVACAAAGSTGTGSDWVNLVSINTLENGSGKTTYSDFRNLSTDLVEGESYTLTIGLNFAFDIDKAYAWIDYNRDGNFEASEAISMSAFSANHKSTGTVVVPSVTTYGVTTMRVRCIYTNNDNPDPCNTYAGEVEDYTINLVDACPYDLAISGRNYFGNDNTLEKVENELVLNNILIQSGANVTFDAGNSLELLPEFEVKLGADFQAIIGGCVD